MRLRDKRNEYRRQLAQQEIKSQQIKQPYIEVYREMVKIKDPIPPKIKTDAEKNNEIKYETLKSIYVEEPPEIKHETLKALYCQDDEWFELDDFKVREPIIPTRSAIQKRFDNLPKPIPFEEEMERKVKDAENERKEQLRREEEKMAIIAQSENQKQQTYTQVHNTPNIEFIDDSSTYQKEQQYQNKLFKNIPEIISKDILIKTSTRTTGFRRPPRKPEETSIITYTIMNGNDSGPTFENEHEANQYKDQLIREKAIASLMLERKLTYNHRNLNMLMKAARITEVDIKAKINTLFLSVSVVKNVKKVKANDIYK
jgi:hypothetical protein